MAPNHDIRSAVRRGAALLAAISRDGEGGAGLRAGDGVGPPRAVAPATTILSPDGAAGDTFGRRVAVSGDRLIVGANGVDRGSVSDVGAAYVYRREGSTWTHEATLQPAATTVPLFFGWSVAIDGDTAVVGALGDNTGGFANRGAAYVFVRTGTTWTQQAKLIMPDGQAGDEAGASVAVHGNRIVVGGPYHDFPGVPDAGAAWVFTRNGAVWTFVSKLNAPTFTTGIRNFGRSAALLNDVIAVGAAPDTIFSVGGPATGAAFVFNEPRSGPQLGPFLQLCPGAHFGVSHCAGSAHCNGHHGNRWSSGSMHQSECHQPAPRTFSRVPWARRSCDD